MINFYSFKNKSYLVSLILIILTIIVIFFKGLNLGIDFKGGLNFEVKTNLTTSQLNQYIDFVDTEREVLIKREVGSDVYSIRIESGENNPVFIVWIRFDWQFAASGIFALLHDVFVAIGFMSLFNIEFNLTMIAALLLIAGYSINDTIVLFDRLRTLTSNEENKDNFETNVNKSIKLNLRRTILTSFTTILALLCLVFLAPVNLTEMPIVFIFGVLIGTFSSLFLVLGIVGDLNYEAVLKARDS